MTDKTVDETLTEIIAERLVTDIVGGGIPPGTRLKFAELRQRYGVGLSPLREALFSLASQGFVETNSRRGFRVAAMSYEDLVDITTVRTMVELAALRQSITLGGDDWEDGIVSAFACLGRAVERARNQQDFDQTKLEPIHKRFHLSLTAATRSPRLRSLQETYYDQANRYRHVMARSLSNFEEFLDIHEQLMVPILARNATMAAACLARHLNMTVLAVYPSVTDTTTP